MTCFVVGCEALPDEIKNGRKIVRNSKPINATHSIDVQVEYECDPEFTYDSENPIINCDIESGLDNSVGECVKGELL